VLVEINEPVVRLHTHKFDEIAFVLKGSGIHEIDGERYPIMRGDVFVIHGRQTHRIVEQQNLILANIIYERNHFQEIKDEFKELPGFTALFVYEPLFRKNQSFKAFLRLSSKQLENINLLKDQIKKEQEERNSGAEKVIEYIFRQLVVILCRYYHTSENMNTKGILKISSAIDYMEKHFADKITIETLYNQLNMSSATFRRIFKKITGSSPIDFLIRFRIEKAAEIMREKPSSRVLDICYSVGFENCGYFGNKFKEIMGTTPKKYLKQYQG
jgi:YesN/AraC family two-component response regulator